MSQPHYSRSDFDFLVYHETQVSALCAQHAINSLLQQNFFTEVDLAEIAAQLDRNELALMQETNDSNSRELLAFIAAGSANVDDGGNFSIQVIRSALSNMNLVVSSVDSESVKQAVAASPANETGYICNLQSHWLSLRKLHGHWFNLNSLQSTPQWISSTFLAMFLTQLKAEGYSIFVVRPDQNSAANQWPKPDFSLVEQSAANNRNKTNRESGKLYHAWDIYSNRTATATTASSSKGSNRSQTTQQNDLARAIALSLQQSSKTVSINSSNTNSSSTSTQSRSIEDEQLKQAIEQSLQTQPNVQQSTDAKPAIAASTLAVSSPAAATAHSLSSNSTTAFNSLSAADNEEAELARAIAMSLQ